MPPRTPVADQVSVSARGNHMTASQQHAQRVDPSGVSLDHVGVSPGVDGVAEVDTVIQDDFARRRADNLDAEAAHYRHRAIQEERALGPGYYVDLLRGMAGDRAAMARRIRTGKVVARDPAGGVPIHNPESTDRRTHRHVRNDGDR